MQFRAIIFDLDGTLLDTLDDIADAMNDVLAARGLPTHPVDAYRHFVGDGVRNLARRTLPESHRDEETIDRFTAEMREAYAKNWNNKSRPYAGVPDMLDELTASGIKLAILSNKPHDFTVKCVTTLLPRWRFDVVMGHHDAIALKPDPSGALEVLAKLGLGAKDVLYVGDSGMDMQTAVRAGMFPLGVLWGFRGGNELRLSGAKELVRTPAEILEFLR